MKFKLPQCEVCKKDAVIGVRDIIRRENLRTGYWDNEPDGNMHFFCKEHERTSSIRELPPIGLSIMG